MDQTQQRGGQGDPTPTSSTSAMPNVVFREIHKNAFLKRHSSDRRTGFPWRSDRVWVVFCVHDDSEPFLEMYSDQKLALTHKPDWFASLSNALHVSPSICGHQDEFEFAVTLTSQVVRLAAPSWDVMMEWVDTIRNKLRELKVLSPKENVYSRMPEPKPSLLPTRDPNSPLPLPPQGPSAILPGVEPVHSDQPSVSESSETRLGRPVENNERRSRPNGVVRSRGVECLDQDGGEVTAPEEVNNVPVEASSRGRVRLNRAVSVPDSPVPHSSNLVAASESESQNVTVIEVPSSRGSHSASECGFFNFQVSDEVVHIEADIADVFFTPPATPKVIPEITPVENAHYEPVFFPDLPKPILLQEVQVRKKADASSSTGHVFKAGEPSHLEQSTSIPKNTKVSVMVVGADMPSCSDTDQDAACSISLQTQAKLEKVNSTGLIPRVPSKAVKNELSKKKRESLEVMEESEQGVEVAESRRGEAVVSKAVPQYSQVRKLPKSKPIEPAAAAAATSDDIVSPVTCMGALSPLSVKSMSVNVTSPPSSSTSSPSPVPSRKKINDIKIQRSHSDKKPEVLPRTSSTAAAAVLKASSSEEGKVKTKESGSRGRKVESEVRQKLETPSTSDTETREPIQIPSNIPVDSEPLTASMQPAVAVINVQDIPLIGGHQRRRRRSSSSDAVGASNTPTRGITGADRIRITPSLAVTSNSTQRTEVEESSLVNMVMQSQVSRLTLREQQVIQLHKEMSHPGGVRLQLRRKDCVGSIALVDVLNSVWVAGWKQREHPMLYNALHIGDQLISVSDVLVRSSADAHKLLRSSPSLYIELIIRRVPFGKVFALHRSSEGQTLGIVQEGNTAEIRDVVPNSIAARQGLAPKTPSCDGLSLTNWFLTEINGRPLNLFFKDNEVRDRLNSVGKEISILVQPHDFIRQMKKQLKGIRSYKDYVVQ